ncbi:MAG: triose-phosphate isomerase [Acidiferrobacterales bacterium]
MRRALVAGNWKMHGTRAQATALLDTILEGVDVDLHAEVAVCPPFLLIPLVAEKLAARPDIAFGAQDLSEHDPGAYTGEVSAEMLRDYGCTYVLVGHSERRILYGEDDTRVAEKFSTAVKAGLTPILCIGETLAQREAGRTEAVVGDQLDAVLDRRGVSSLTRAVVAYEPVWAIGTGRTATPQQAQEVHAFIRAKVAVIDGTVADNLRILYGGSVKAGKAVALFREPDIDGGLIGGASLDANEFLAICRAA